MGARELNGFLKVWRRIPVWAKVLYAVGWLLTAAWVSIMYAVAGAEWSRVDLRILVPLLAGAFWPLTLLLLAWLAPRA